LEALPAGTTPRTAPHRPPSIRVHLGKLADSDRSESTQGQLHADWLILVSEQQLASNDSNALEESKHNLRMNLGTSRRL